jgi:5-methyltetrahydropteroyltriglutamate--homocysteine methyltransferase
VAAAQSFGSNERPLGDRRLTRGSGSPKVVGVLRSTSRILTTHVGSLPRPESLDRALGQRAEAESAYAAALSQAVAGVVRQQVDVGLDVINDGEFGKSSWTGYVTERLGGFEPEPATAEHSPLNAGRDRALFADFYDEATRDGRLWYRPDGRLSAHASAPQPRRWVCTGPITYVGSGALLQDISNFTAALASVGRTPADAFLPVAAPASIEPGRSNAYYSSTEAYVYALAEALRVEYEAIVDAGFTLQVDDAWITALWDRMLPDIDVDRYREYCLLRIDALNHALRSIPEERVRYHICWGSWHGPHATDIPMDFVAELMLRVNARAYLFEAANVRHEHEYHVWEHVALPENKVLIPGVVSHATNVLEHPELIAERIRRFVDRVGPERVMAGTDCGLGGRVHPQLAWAKLEALVAGAALASTSLART